VKGKRGKPLCEEGQVIREGQVVCYLEQLGTQQPVEVYRTKILKACV
jgi:biotin carboxyl carrier protein